MIKVLGYFANIFLKPALIFPFIAELVIYKNVYQPFFSTIQLVKIHGQNRPPREFLQVVFGPQQSSAGGLGFVFYS